MDFEPQGSTDLILSGGHCKKGPPDFMITHHSIQGSSFTIMSKDIALVCNWV